MASTVLAKSNPLSNALGNNQFSTLFNNGFWPYSGVKFYSGSAWIEGQPKYWNGAQWKAALVKRWDGAQWVQVN